MRAGHRVVAAFGRRRSSGGWGSSAGRVRSCCGCAARSRARLPCRSASRRICDELDLFSLAQDLGLDRERRDRHRPHQVDGEARHAHRHGRGQALDRPADQRGGGGAVLQLGVPRPAGERAGFDSRGAAAWTRRRRDRSLPSTLFNSLARRADRGRPHSMGCAAPLRGVEYPAGNDGGWLDSLLYLTYC